jgi:hypothetical protein
VQLLGRNNQEVCDFLVVRKHPVHIAIPNDHKTLNAIGADMNFAAMVYGVNGTGAAAIVPLGALGVALQTHDLLPQWAPAALICGLFLLTPALMATTDLYYERVFGNQMAYFAASALKRSARKHGLPYSEGIASLEAALG